MSTRPSTPSDLIGDKAAWRARIRRDRRELADGWTPRSRARTGEQFVEPLIRFLLERDPAGRADPEDLTGLTLTAFEPMRTEPPVDLLTTELRRRGARVLVPITLERPRLDWADLADPDRAGLGEGVLAEVDVALIPALAVGRDGRRLGQGGGYYDTVLPRLRALSGTAPVVAVLHDHELVSSVPAAAHDAPVDAVLRPGHGITLLPVGDAQ